MSLYLEHFGLSAPPFRITPQTAWFYAGAQRGALLDALLYAIFHDEGIIKVSGEVGVGKTMLCRMLIERLPAEVQVIYIANPSLAPDALLQTIALELGVRDTPALTLLRAIETALIERYAEGRRVVAIIDEAHAMPRESLEQIRLLSNLESADRKLLQLVLFGQTELDELLALREMRSLHDRITQHFSLGPLRRKDVGAYLRHRLEAAGYRGPDLFDRDCISLIAEASRGLTRRINILADKTLMAAFADKTRNISRRHVRQAADDARYNLPPARRWRGALLLAALTLVISLGSLIWMWRPSQLQTLSAPPVRAETLPPEATSSTRAAQMPLATSAPSASPAPATPASISPPPGHDRLGPVAQALLLASRVHLDAAPASRFFVQLQRVSEADAASLEASILRLQQTLDPAQLRLYSAIVDGRIRFGVIFGDFESAREAVSAIGKLPEWLRNQGAYPRQYAALK